MTLVIGEYTISELRAGREVTVHGVTLMPADDIMRPPGPSVPDKRESCITQVKDGRCVFVPVYLFGVGDPVEVTITTPPATQAGATSERAD